VLKKSETETVFWRIDGEITIASRCSCPACPGCQVTHYAFNDCIMPSPKKWTAVAAQVISFGGDNPPMITPEQVEYWEGNGTIRIQPATEEEIRKWMDEHAIFCTSPRPGNESTEGDDESR